jgi:hypothetical protein
MPQSFVAIIRRNALSRDCADNASLGNKRNKPAPQDPLPRNKNGSPWMT